ncbi:hypothetical protein SAMN05444008_105144 [Cnuella takakiae]|uniref:Uncharacterized protein n=1 Tax=Cnuella takakiae TaxID=1302690 RepID=A0A1M4Z9Z4_9BACT|nr:hypothetical protein BUE76_22125 [Cnuella takakiae]SHF14795.1 hypothetical protein SAMN05444008_105144 [Cnuella takakiae]
MYWRLAGMQEQQGHSLIELPIQAFILLRVYFVFRSIEIFFKTFLLDPQEQSIVSILFISNHKTFDFKFCSLAWKGAT